MQIALPFPHACVRRAAGALAVAALLVPGMLATAAPAVADPTPSAPAFSVTTPPLVEISRHDVAIPLRSGGTFSRRTASDGTHSALVAAPPAGPVRSTWQVTYTGFTTQARASFQAAVDIWARIVTSTVPIKVNATFSALPTNVLGSAGASMSYADSSIGDGVSFYPSALADAVYGADVAPLAGGSPSDITAEFTNAAVGFYFGTDGAPAADQIDFESVVLHELGHGLGFAGSAFVSGGYGSYNDTPDRFDRFTYDAASAGASVLSHPNDSTNLGALLQSQSVYWGGPNGRTANAGARPRLYAPTTWDEGSSYSHLDEATYGVGNANSLMTPAIGDQEAIHSPGPIVVGVFKDMGWTASLPLPDTTKPTVSSPALAAFSLQPTLVFHYAGADAGSGIASYDVTYRKAPYNAGFNNLYSPILWRSTKLTSVTLTTPKNFTYCMSVRSRDRAGNVSGWTSEHCTSTALDDRSLVASAGWVRSTSSAYYAGTGTTVAKTGATLSRTAVQTRRVAIVATKCRGCGTLGVYWNNVLVKSVSLNATTTSYRQIINVTDFGSVRAGTLMLKTLSPARVYVDGLGLSRT